MLPLRFLPENMGGNVLALKNYIAADMSTSVFYAAENSRYHLSGAMDRFFLLVTPDSVSARNAYEILSEYYQDIVKIPEKNELLLNVQAYYSESLKERMEALSMLCEGKAKGAVISSEALLQYLPKKSLFCESIIKLKVGGTIDLSNLQNKLIMNGYKKEDVATEVGVFSIKGGIIDIYSVNSPLPVRIELFGDEIESLRLFSPETMSSIKEIEEITIAPRTDIFISAENIAKLKTKLLNMKRAANGRLNEVLSEIYEKVDIENFSSLQWITPFVLDDLSTVFDYIPSNAIVCLDEVSAIEAKLKLNINAFNTRLKSFVETGDATSHHKQSILNLNEVYSLIKKHTVMGFQQVMSANPIFEPQAIVNIKSLPVTKYHINTASLITDIKNMLYNGQTVFLYAGNPDKAEALSNFLFENDLNGIISTDTNNANGLLIVPERISKGFIYPKEKITLIGTDDAIKKTSKSKSLTRKKGVFLTPEKGDYVVHEKHGIGVFEGIVKLKVEGGIRDYYCVLYHAGDKLYLPVDQIDKLEKYTGGGTPRIHRLGGKEFERVKERVKASVKKLAIDLLKIYEKRLNSKGFKYQPDTVWQKELEDSFPYTETEDQLVAVSEIKEDMESGKLMDRLLCGDVGFGKTEVAIRAIFKTVIEGKQAAILSPTTILCQQHYNTISERFKSFGITVDVLSRFMSEEYIKGALERIKNGKTSVIVATHRLLSKDVCFNDLALLVLDEEQRFGVEHKEKIKSLKTDVNILSLSATPIPRTLHMSLSGIRDISTLETPPKDRLPVETYVMEYSDALLKDAVRREISRGGQVFILYNRVTSIDTFHNYVSDLLGDGATVIYAHGQLSSYELEERIRMFYNKEANVLISTTIIENGIDLPDANTLFVIDADRLGLSELYQLRGRVGRSSTLAYAYFTVREGKVLTKEAELRLEAIMTHTTLGSGFKIAMEDLEIRGAGNILGREQHGNMEKVGYELYCKLLNEGLDELKGITTNTKRDVEIVVDGDVMLPDDYITFSEHRIRFYKEVAALDKEEDELSLIKRTSEIYGKCPRSVLNLIAIGLIKNLAAKLSVQKLILTRKELTIRFYDQGLFNNQNIFKALGDFKDKAILIPKDNPEISLELRPSAEQRIALVKSFLLASAPLT